MKLSSPFLGLTNASLSCLLDISTSFFTAFWRSQNTCNISNRCCDECPECALLIRSAPTMDPIHVIGHKNPDTDAICSAIGYAAFLRDVRGLDAHPACCGEINARTNWVLKLAGVEAPKLLLDVRPTAGIVGRKRTPSAQKRGFPCALCALSWPKSIRPFR